MEEGGRAYGENSGDGLGWGKHYSTPGALPSSPAFHSCLSRSQKAPWCVSPGRREVYWLPGSEFLALVSISFGEKSKRCTILKMCGHKEDLSCLR